MRLGIMQPYFFPYIGYFSLIKHVDLFVLLDTVQFIRHGWIERNRMLKQGEGWLYIQVPLIKAEGRNTIIKNCLIDNTKNWKGKILEQIKPYRKKAPYYKTVERILQELFSNEYRSIVDLNYHSLKIINDYLCINTDLKIFSEMNLIIDTPNKPDEWALNIMNKMEDFREYINPIGGINLFNPEKYLQKGINLSFIEQETYEYNQGRETFEASLSILDVLMFNSPVEVNYAMDNVRFI